MIEEIGTATELSFEKFMHIVTLQDSKIATSPYPAVLDIIKGPRINGSNLGTSVTRS